MLYADSEYNSGEGPIGVHEAVLIISVRRDGPLNKIKNLLLRQSSK